MHMYISYGRDHATHRPSAHTPAQTLGDHTGGPKALTPSHSEGTYAPYAAPAAERRRAAMRLSDFWIALAPCITQAEERR